MSHAPGKLWIAIAVAAFMVLSSSLVLGGALAPQESSATASPAPVVTTSVTSTPAHVSSTGSARNFGINEVLASAVEAKEQRILAAGGSLADFHPPNLHQAPALTSTHGVVTPLYSVAPAPLGVAYYGLSNTTGTIQGTVVNTTSLAGTWNTTDSIGTAAELFDTSSGNSAGAFGAQLNTVLVNVTIKGQTSFANPSDSNEAPNFCPTTSFYRGLPGNACPNEFWLQNYIEYTESTHTLTISNEIWNFSNPTADWASSQSGGTNTIAGFGSVEEGEVYQGPSSGTISVAPPFSLALYINYTQGPCHTDSVAGTGIGSCGSVSTSAPVNELFMNYTVRNAAGTRVCPSTLPTGRVCGEDDDVFFNSVGPSNPGGVPLYGPCPTYPIGCTPSNSRIGSATIQANGTGYDPVGLTNDYEFDYGIGSDDGATNNIVYQNGVVGVNYCQNPNAVETSGGAISCATYSPTPAAVDYGGETGETSTGEMAYWSPQGTPGVPYSGVGPTLLTGASTPITHLVTGPSLLVGLWNMTGSTSPPTAQPYTGGSPYPAYTGGEPLSYKNIAPANAWIGIAQDDQSPTAGAGVQVTSQSFFQVAPTFGFFSYWKGSGGAPTATTLGANLYLPTGWYTIEVMLSGYTPVMQQIDLTGPTAPTIVLSPNPSTGAYTPEWAFSAGDLANISTNSGSFGLGSIGNQYRITSAAPTVGAPYGVSGSLSWLFSNLNDYLFTVWIGEFINSTTVYAQSNPAPSFLMDYPSWQLSSLAEFNVPSTDQFQIYLNHVQNFTLAGTTGIYGWANSEAATLYSVVCNTCANDLVADNTFAVSDLGMEFINGGTTAPVGAALFNTRNVIWGNTFSPDPQPSYTGLLSPSTGLTIGSRTAGESFDRIWNNAFYTNATVSATSSSSDFWNVTCQSGYAPLSQSTYPGSTVCQPASFVTSYLGFSLSGSIIGTAYQGGNFWFNYGNIANPYGNIPYVARASSPVGTAAIGSTVQKFNGDYAPLIGYSVYDPTFFETGLPSSSTASAFEVRIFGGGGSGWFNETQTATPSSVCSGTPCAVFYVPSGSYTYDGFSSLAYAANPATGSFTVSGAPVGSVTTFSFAASHAVTFTETGLTSGTHWTVSIPGQLSVTSATTTAVFNLPNGVYSYSIGTVSGHVANPSSGSITVSGAAVGQTIVFSVPSIVVGPTQGPIGATVTVSGTGFSGSTTLTSLVFDSVAISSCSSGSLSTSPTGAWSCTFAVPSGTSGTSVVATDSGGLEALGSFTVTTPAITVTPGQGPVGATVTVAGTGFSVSTPLASLDFDGVTVASCNSGSLTTAASGAFSCTFAVPSGTSGTTVTATDVGGETAVGTFTVTSAAITVTPSQGPVGASVTVTGSGFSVSSTLASLEFDGVGISSCASGSLTTSVSGTFSCSFAVPSGTSGTSVVATDVGGATAAGTFTVTTPALLVSPSQGPVGASVTVSGSGFSVSSPLAALTFDGVAISSCTTGSLTTSASGAFSCTFPVPSGTSGTTVSATDAGGTSATGSFTVTTPAISVSPGQGPVGATVTVAGSGFSVSTPLASLVFDGIAVSSCTVGSLTSGATGAFSCTFAVPSGTSGSTVLVTDAGGSTASGAFTVTTPAITVTPGQGPIGATVTVAGTGFSVSTPLASLGFDGVAISSCGSGSLTTDGTGAFSCTFAVPSGTSGTTVLATDAGGSTASGTFTVTTPAITVTPGRGPVGATVTVSGTGFSVSSPLASLVFDSVAVSACSSGSLSTDGSGAFSCTFAVPSGTSGTTVLATDTGGQTATGTFRVTVPSITVTPGQGPVGATVTVAGTGFSVSTPIASLVFDGVAVSACSAGSLTTDGVGAFSCTFAVPGGTSGTSVLATDAGGATASGSFTVTTPAITVTPGQGPIGATVTVAGSGFSVSTALGSLSFDGVLIASCSSGSLSASASGAFSCTFAVPSGTSGTTVTATDAGGATATGSFTVTTPAISVAPAHGPVGATVTVSGTGFSVSTGLASLVLDGVAITSCNAGSLTTSASGAFSCTFKVPSGTSGTTLKATDVGGQSATTTFKVTTPKITVTPARGPIGATVTISGTGFSASSTVTLVFDNVAISSCSGGGGLTTLASGAFSCTLKVPSGTSGTTVTATDVGGKYATAAFKVTTPAITLSPKKGPIGTSVTLTGSGFSVTSTVGLVFDNVVISSCTTGSLTTNATGAFSCTFSVPSGTSGTTVTATDVGGQYATAKFTVT